MDPAVLDQMLANLPVRNDPNLLIGFGTRDDAAVYRLPTGDLLVQTLDFFTPVVDDPYDYGAIAAANSLSDVYAMNGRPLFALNICCFPKTVPASVWNEVLRGGAETAIAAEISVVGGHTIDDSEPKYGLAVTGLADLETYWANGGAKVGDALILTKPLGTGVITTALKNEILTAREAQPAVDSMKALNAASQRVLAEYDVHACTDVTGNGLLGHAAELARASEVKLILERKSFPFFDGAAELAEAGQLPGGSRANRLHLGAYVEAGDQLNSGEVWLLYDAQTSGGLFCAVNPTQAEDAVRRLRESGVPHAAIVGQVAAGSGIEIH